VRPRPKKWSRDHAGLETLTSLAAMSGCVQLRYNLSENICY